MIVRIALYLTLFGTLQQSFAREVDSICINISTVPFDVLTRLPTRVPMTLFQTGMTVDHARLLDDVVRRTARVLADQGVTLALWAGSLLGALRHGGQIPWDDDVDFLFMSDDLPRLQSDSTRYALADEGLALTYFYRNHFNFKMDAGSHL